MLLIHHSCQADVIYHLEKSSYHKVYPELYWLIGQQFGIYCIELCYSYKLLVNLYFRLNDLQGEEQLLQRILVEQMISLDPMERPPASAVRVHPIFWNKAQILTFFQVKSVNVWTEYVELLNDMRIQSNYLTGACAINTAELKLAIGSCPEADQSDLHYHNPYSCLKSFLKAFHMYK